jgi:hypothetical protein
MLKQRSDAHASSQRNRRRSPDPVHAGRYSEVVADALMQVGLLVGINVQKPAARPAGASVARRGRDVRGCAGPNFKQRLSPRNLPITDS